MLERVRNDSLDASTVAAYEAVDGFKLVFQINVNKASGLHRLYHAGSICALAARRLVTLSTRCIGQLRCELVILRIHRLRIRDTSTAVELGDLEIL